MSQGARTTCPSSSARPAAACALAVGDSIMYALVAGDIRENVLDALTTLIRRIKAEVVHETELR